MDDAIEYLCEELSFFSTKDSVTHMHRLAVRVKEGVSSPRDLNFGNSEDSPSSFRLALLHSEIPFDLPYITYQFLSINSSTNVFVFRDYQPS